VPGRYILHRVGPRVKSNGRKVMSGYPSWHMSLCGDDAHTIGIRIVVVKVCKLCRVKTIRIAASAVMDGWDGRYRAVSSFGFENDFQRKCVCWKYRKGTGKMLCRPCGDGRGK
jgi:hypothetical protein